jgi:chemotaxis family two-component system sensor kinase Cph1
MTGAGANGSLSGRRVLVAEDEAIASLALCDLLELDGALVVGPAANVRVANELAAAHELDAALLDLDLGGQPSLGVAALLCARGVPVVFLTGFTAPELPAELASCTVLAKPATGPEVRAALAGAIARRAAGDAG